ncbi:hypothetical protein [Vreelandella nanhaiensis]|nr:hypothetical protein [Halomonas nanhaiensis]
MTFFRLVMAAFLFAINPLYTPPVHLSLYQESSDNFPPFSIAVQIDE